MIRTQWLFLLLLTCLTFKAQAQGYYGKKTVISIDGSLRGTLIYNSLLADYGYNDGTFQGSKSTHFIAAGFGASASHYFSKRVGIGLDFHMAFNYIKTPNEFWHYGSYYDPNSPGGNVSGALITLEQMRMRSIYIIPKFEWSSRGNLPIGFSHSIGIGYVRTSVVDDDYNQSIGYVSSTGGTTIVKSTFKGRDVAPVHGIVMEYGVKIRFPVTSFMTLNVGSNLRFHIPSPERVFTGSDPSLEGHIQRSMRTSRTANIMDVRAGISFILF